MSYMLLIMEPHGQRAERTAEQGTQAYASMLAFAADLKSRGLLRATESLKTGGIRVAVRDGKRMRIDGPFAEAKELVGGFFLLDCDNEEQAIEIAGRCPAAAWATVEVRELGPCFS
ncbi:MAG TPA: YciI family protein [Rudaea sp.]|nr:YciI family protein [Rudaea sp.]HSC09793.1 YciI family protein [Rhodanobacteraceae bacterium]